MKEETKIDHLERLHSFSMKRASSTSNDSRGLESMNEINTQSKQNMIKRRTLYYLSKSTIKFIWNLNIGSTIDKQSRNSSTNVCYVEEKFKGIIF